MACDNDYCVHRLGLYKILGFKSGKMPADFAQTLENVALPRRFSRGESVPGTWTVKVTPTPPKSYAKHRIFVVCRCGRDIPSGRLHQHRAKCKA